VGRRTCSGTTAIALADTSALEFAGRTALVTGAGGNIGAAVAHLLMTRGATVIAADLQAAEAGLDALVARCAGLPGRMVCTHFDVTNGDEIRTALSDIEAETGGADLLFNNAGYQGDFASTAEYNVEDFKRIMDINVTGAFRVLQVVAQHMIGTGTPGSIVNTASMAGVAGAPNMVAYSASKAAVIAMTKSAAKDLAPAGIRVNAISPAFIGPGMMWDRQVQLQSEANSIYYDADPGVVAKQMIDQVPMRRYGSLEEVAEVAAFLLSERSSYVTGTNTEIAGGAS